MSLATRLKELRIQNGGSLQQVADSVGASKTHVFDLERGNATNPSIDLLIRLARFYNHSVADLVGENPELPMENKDIVMMYRDLQELSPGDRQTIQVLINSLRTREKEILG